MKVLNVRNAIEALGKGILLIKDRGEHINSRAGMTIEVPWPVATVYSNPWERVLISKLRDANPFFHLMEAMWILAGRKDVKFLTEFNKSISNNSDDGETFNASYGYRLRNGSYKDQAHQLYVLDQLSEVINLLKNNPDTHQAVCQIWDRNDLIRQSKDKVCNMCILFRIRNNKLCMTVYNRSNDIIWGAYGANVVQFSMIQEYVAAYLDLPLGKYTQVSNSYYIYSYGTGGTVWNCIKDAYEGNVNIYDELVHNRVYMLSDEILSFEHDIRQFFNAYDQCGIEGLGDFNCWHSQYFNKLIMPQVCVYLIYKQRGPKQALKYTYTIQADDWRLACEDWLTNRTKP